MACRILLNRSGSRVIVQNPDDRDVLISQGIVKSEKVHLIRGAGVDVEQFAPRAFPDGAPLVVLPARLLWEKGVGEFVSAATILRNKGYRARFALVGEPDADNPRAIPVSQLEMWQKEGLVEWWGRRTDMPDVYAQSSVVCLPTSYGEGIPKSLLEAAACGRPIVTTDAPGCREVVRHGENGYLVPLRDAEAVAKAIGELLRNPGLRVKMGEKGRELAVREFSVQQVVNQTLALYDEVLAK
jgi:glycosyltransferase involved in cell wall biosynthesis